VTRVPKEVEKRNTSADDASHPRWYLRPSFVILLLFFVLGPFGLPLLFKSPGFGKTWKIILAVAVIVYTVYLLFASLKIGIAVYEGMKQFGAS
jgi:hypothetical protein